MEKSKMIYERARKIVPGGVHSNSRARSPHPLYFDRAKGPYMYDVDGNEYIDLIMGNGTVIFGHNYEPFIEKFQSYLPDGLLTGVETELSIDVSEKFLKFVDHDQVRFTNTGTEAINHVIHLARAYSKKNDIAVSEGSYNGWTDNVQVSTFPDLSKAGDEDNPIPVPGFGGLDSNVVKNTVVFPFNKWEATENILRKESDRLACVIIEPIQIDVGYIEPDLSYIIKLRKLCDELNIVLVFDELLTGFRVDLRGAQNYFNVKPDLSIFGKAIANGYILAAVAGRKEVMETSAPGGTTNFVGTYNGHQVSLAAAKAVFELLEEGNVHDTLNRMTGSLKSEFENNCKKKGVPGHFVGKGGHIHWYFSEKPITSYREAVNSDHQMFSRYSESLSNQKCLVSNKVISHHKLSLSHDGEPLEILMDRMTKAFENL